MVFSFFIDAAVSPFQIAFNIRHRFDRLTLLRIFGLILKTSIMFAGIEFSAYRLAPLGAGNLAQSLCIAAGGIAGIFFFLPELKISLFDFHRNQFIIMSKTIGWGLVNTIGAVLFLYTDIVLINRFLSTHDAGLYAPVIQLSTMINTLSTSLLVIIAPISFENVARQSANTVVRTTSTAIRLLGMFIALPIGLVCGCAQTILLLWVGPEFSTQATVVWLLVGVRIFTIPIQPVSSVLLARNKVAVPAIATIFGGLLNVVLTILFLLFTTWKLVGVSFATFITLGPLNICFLVLYSGIVLAGKPAVFLRPAGMSVIFACGVAVVSRLLISVIPTASLMTLVSTLLAVTIAYFLLMYAGYLTGEEKVFLRTNIQKGLARLNQNGGEG
jgi:membrane protein EpsK